MDTQIGGRLPPRSQLALLLCMSGRVPPNYTVGRSIGERLAAHSASCRLLTLGAVTDSGRLKIFSSKDSGSSHALRNTPRARVLKVCLRFVPSLSGQMIGFHQKMERRRERYHMAMCFTPQGVK